MIVDPDTSEHSPDPVVTARIEALAGYGLSGAEIAHVLRLRISEETLLAQHAASIESGRKRWFAVCTPGGIRCCSAPSLTTAFRNTPGTLGPRH